MKRRRIHNRNKQFRATQVGLIGAAGTVPVSFQKSLMPRDTKDQGIITGLSMAILFSLGSGLQKLYEDTADQLAGTTEAEDNDYRAHVRQRRFTMALQALTAAGGYIVERKLDSKPADDKTAAVLRTAANWGKRSSLAGLSVGTLQELIELSSRPTDVNGNPKVTHMPVGMLGGALFATYYEYMRRQSEKGTTLTSSDKDIKPAEAIAMGVGVLSVLGAMSYGQRKAADVMSTQLGRLFPGSEDLWWNIGHLGAVATTGVGITALMRNVYHKIEGGAAQLEKAFYMPPDSKLCSGSKTSMVDWTTLSVQGRRFVSTATPRDQISTVMGTSATHDPIRCYVGLDSADNEKERLQLAMFELERTKAFEREAILLVSPTGTGYVNYVAVEAAEMMSQGNIATIALQYSKRPSPMSLDRVDEGRLQFRMLVKAVSKRAAEQPKNKQPRILVFGESLGAWTSQDAFIDQGTDGLLNAGIDRAIWIGTPYGSKWKTQVLGNERPDVEKTLVGKFDNISELRTLDRAVRKDLRYCMITHYNDPVALFGASLLYQRPDWLTDPKKRPPTVSHSQFYTSPGTFLLTLIDMKNAMNVIPGQFEASGHDYRADLASFVREVYNYKNVTDRQLSAIEKQLRANELDRARKLGEDKPKKNK